MALKILSNYSDEEQNLDAPLLEAISADGTNLDYVRSGNSYTISGWLPGKNLDVRLKLSGNPGNGLLFINWYCPATHLRGWLFSKNSVSASGTILGNRVRNRIELSPALIDRQGRTLAQSPKVTLRLDGREAYFPTFSVNFDQPDTRAFCRLVLDPSVDLDSLFSRESLHSEFNRGSRFCDSDTGMPADETARFFARYEIWRQLIETMLNKEEEFTELKYHVSGEDDRISTAVSGVLRRVFPSMTLDEIRRYRKDEYTGFCSRVQHIFFYDYYFNPFI